MIQVSSEQLITWLNAFIWPLTRILGLIAVAPVFGNAAVPVRVKIAFGFVLAMIVAPTLEHLPTVDPVSLKGLAILCEQIVIGIAMGFTIQIVFGCIDLAGNLIGMAMGLNFAMFFDPLTHSNTPAMSQFLTFLTTMLFLSMNLHLTLLSTLAESFTTLPIGSALIDQAGIWMHIAKAASIIFSSGVHIALPIIAALLVTNIALGILTRAAPQLNIFGVGFPVMLAAGFGMLFIIIPYLTNPLGQLLRFGIEQAALR